MRRARPHRAETHSQPGRIAFTRTGNMHFCVRRAVRWCAVLYGAVQYVYVLSSLYICPVMPSLPIHPHCSHAESLGCMRLKLGRLSPFSPAC